MIARVPPLKGPTLTWTNQVLVFGVSVGIGLSPLLGLVGVPGFVSLIELFPSLPQDNRRQLIAVAAILMGFTALASQYLGGERSSRKARRRLFVSLLTLGFVCALALFVVFQLAVELVGVHHVLVGFGEPTCPECSSVGRVGCLEARNALASTLERCFSGPGRRSSGIALGLLYIGTLVSLGGMAGLLMRQRRR